MRIVALLVLSACAGRDAGTAPHEPWREAPGPGWVMLEPVRTGRAVFIEPAALRREGEMRAATVVMNFTFRNLTRTGQPIRSQLFSLEIDCAARTYAPVRTIQFDGFAGRGQHLAEARLDDLPSRAAVAGSVAEQLIETLCAG